ncbi:hypothetical protein NOK12_16680 [Nocardioides sp. OK12]|nr:hypothetical protein NOK12_16680 [Nocardioides sp. OK12]
MSRHDSQPPMDDFVPEARPCPSFERPGYQIAAVSGSELSIPPNIVLGSE